MKRFEITEAVGEAFRQAGGRPWMTLLWGVISLLPTMAGIGLILAEMQPVILTNGEGYPDEMAFDSFIRLQGAGLLINIVEWLVAIMLIAAVTRATFAGRRRDGFAFMRIGVDEFRVLVASLVIAIVMVVAIVVVVLLVLAVGATLWSLPVLARLPLYLTMGFGVFLLMLLAAGRAALIVPATVRLRKLAFEEGLALGQGQTWRLAGLVLMLILVALALSLLFALVILVVALVIGFGGWSVLDTSGDILARMYGVPWGLIGLAAAVFLPLCWVQGFFMVLGNAPFAHVVAALDRKDDDGAGKGGWAPGA